MRNVATNRPSAAPAAAGDQLPQKRPWLWSLKWLALGCWLAIPLVGVLAPPVAGRLTWSVVVASLPLFIVLIGYHNWRRICPLAFFSHIGVLTRRPGRRRISSAVERYYCFIPFATFFVALWLRLIWTNGDGVAIAVFFLLLSLCAIAVGFVFTGKSWCNYICPVSFIEKIYTEPRGLRDTPNSQCEKCTACKTACPDINEETGYWKEIDSTPKRFVYFAYPGLVFGFYLYFFLKAGSWEYFFGGSWMNEPGLLGHAFESGTDATLAGFYFLPWVPRAAAAALTLAICAMLSLGGFLLIDRMFVAWSGRGSRTVDASRVRNISFGLAAFTAFVTFYSFAGQPILREVEWLPPYTNLLVVVVATLLLVRRVARTRERFTEQSLARSIIKHWSWPDTPPPTNLHDAYVINAARSTERRNRYAEMLNIYQDAVSEILADGIVTRSEGQQLEMLRDQLGIRPADHERVMARLADEERVLLTDPGKQASSEKRLQLETYARALERYLQPLAGTDAPTNDDFVQRLRTEFGVTVDEHQAVVAHLFEDAGMAAVAADGVKLIDRTTCSIGVLSGIRSPAIDALIDLLRRDRARTVDRMLRTLAFSPDDALSLQVREGLLSDVPELYDQALGIAQAALQPGVRDYLARAHAEALGEAETRHTPIDVLNRHVADADPFVRAMALYTLAERGWLDSETLERTRADVYALVRDTAVGLAEREAAPSGGGGGTDPAAMLTIEKMIAIRGISIFDSLVPDALEELARSSAERRFQPGEAVCFEGEVSDELFVMLSGEARVVHGPAADGELVRVENMSGVIGELSVLDASPRSASVFAGASGAHALRLSGSTFRKLLHDDPAIADGVLQTLAHRLRIATEQHHVNGAP
jgi:hypothetical protein